MEERKREKEEEKEKKKDDRLQSLIKGDKNAIKLQEICTSIYSRRGH